MLICRELVHIILSWSFCIQSPEPPFSVLSHIPFHTFQNSSLFSIIFPLFHALNYHHHYYYFTLYLPTFLRLSGLHITWRIFRLHAFYLYHSTGIKAGLFSEVLPLPNSAPYPLYPSQVFPPTNKLQPLYLDFCAWKGSEWKHSLQVKKALVFL